MKQWFQKVIQKQVLKNVDFLSILGSKMESDRVHKGLLSQVGSPGGPRGSPGVDFGRILGDFGESFGVFLVTVLRRGSCM